MTKTTNYLAIFDSTNKSLISFEFEFYDRRAPLNSFVSFLPYDTDKQCWVTVTSWVFASKKFFFVLSSRSSRSFSFVFEKVRLHVFDATEQLSKVWITTIIIMYFQFLCIIIISLWWYEFYENRINETQSERDREESIHCVYEIFHK